MKEVLAREELSPLFLIGMYSIPQRSRRGTSSDVLNRLNWWAERNDCTNPPSVEDSFDGDVHHSIWTCQGTQGVLQHWKVDDMGELFEIALTDIVTNGNGTGHCWASTEPNFSQLSIGQGPTHIEASQLIIEFFDQFTKP